MNFYCVFLILLGIIRSLSFPTTCQVGEWQCSDGTCIQLNGRCDNFPDCNDGSDEDKCTVTPVCLEGLESCPQPNGTTVCVDKAIGCGCGLVPHIAHGTIGSDNNTIGSSANVTCDAGYETATPSILCQDTGSWETAVCSPKDCGPIGKIQFAAIYLSDSKNTTFGAPARVVCDAGYETLTPIVTCRENGKWDTSVCTRIDCGPAPAISFGNITFDFDNNSTVGATASVRCADNYSANTSTITCQASGVWTQASCISKGCGSVYKISHGIITSNDKSSIGTSAIVTCDVGYKANTSKVTCMSSGDWESAKCSAKDCGPAPEIAFGKVILIDLNNTSYGASASVTCDTGYETNVSKVLCQSSGVWHTAVCTAKDCGLVPEIAFGKINLTDAHNTTYGASARVSCDAGYETNMSIVSCRSSGEWERAICKAKDCGPVPVIVFGKINLIAINNTTYGTSASVTCEAGYEANVSAISCQGSGEWETAVCKAKECGPVPAIAFGTINLIDMNSTTYGASAGVTCDNGYTSNVSTISCQRSGKWETAICKAIDCGPVSVLAFGKIKLTDLNNTTYGASAGVTCDTGYKTNMSTISCQSSGEWETTICKALDCGPVPAVAFGKINLNAINNTSYGASAAVTCDTGYGANVSTVSCQRSGVWQTAICKAKDCGLVPEIAFGKINLTDVHNTTYGASASVTCDTGYETNMSIVSCRSSGEWETALCKAKDCGPVPVIVFGKINLIAKNSTTYDTSASVTCDTGYEANVSTISCQGSGEWETTICKAKDCGHVPVITFGKIHLIDMNNATYGASAGVTCDNGYKTNVSTISCQRSGKWETAICTAIDCGPVPVLAFGKIKLTDVNNATYGASASITCDRGYNANVSTISCQSSGEWETTTCKAKDCSTTPVIANGKISSIDINNTSYGASASISCDTGFEANTSKIACQSSGLWEIAVCKAKDCGPVPVIPHGKIDLVEVNNTTYGASANVTCDTGFQSNVSYIACQRSGVWSTAICEVKDCGVPPVIAFGNISLSVDNNSTFGATAFVTCNENYVTSKPIVTCKSTGIWENVACFSKGCRSIPTISHGNIIATGNTSIGSVANVTCDLGYEASLSTVMCQVSGIWETAECKVKACDQAPTIKHGRVNLIDNFHTSFGDTANVVCDTGYETSTAKVTCQSSGIWETALCTAKDCGHPPLISNGNISLRNDKMSTYGAEALINCNDKYVANVSKIKCQSSGLWEIAQCAPEGQLNFNRCTKEHGVCTQDIYENVRLLALRSSECRSYCHCAHAGTLVDGSVTYKWVERSCPLGTLFDDNILYRVCNHHYMVWC